MEISEFRKKLYPASLLGEHAEALRTPVIPRLPTLHGGGSSPDTEPVSGDVVHSHQPQNFACKDHYWDLQLHQVDALVGVFLGWSWIEGSR